MSALEHLPQPEDRRPLGLIADRRTIRRLAAVERDATVRLARVQAHGLVQAEKSREIDRLTTTAMTGQAMLSKVAATLAQGDAFIADDCKLFTDLAKFGKAQLLSDTIADFGREGRRW